MTSLAPHPTMRILVAVALALALLGGQAVSDANIPRGARPSAADPLGRASFAYLTGLRRFAALVLYNRLEPQFHEYYRDKPVEKLTFLMPSFRLITWLDPQSVQPYYVGAWQLYRNGRQKDGLALAREGVRFNPRSGLLRMSYTQILFLAKSDVAEQVRQADAAMGADTQWQNGEEEWAALVLFKDVYSKAGLPAKAEAASARAQQIEKTLGGKPILGEEDEAP